METDLATDERLLSIEFACGNGDGGVPTLFHPDVLGVGRTWSERGLALANGEVVRNVTLGAVTYDLCDADAVSRGDLTHLFAGGDLETERADPVEAEISDHGPVFCLIVEWFVDDRHPEADIEEWVFAAWTSDASLGIISGHRIVGRKAWYWAALARRGKPLLHITDFDVPIRSDPFIVKGPALWAEHTCDAEMQQWTIGNETYASAIDDPAEALGQAYGHPTAVAFDLEWYATGPGKELQPPSASTPWIGYEQPGVVHGVVDLHGEAPLEFAEIPAHRWHRWSIETGAGSPGAFGALMLPEAMAHTGVRAPFAFPDGSISDLVLTSRGWARRARPARASPAAATAPWPWEPGDVAGGAW